MAVYENLNDIIKDAQRKITEILKNDIAPIAEEIVQSHIQSDIYYAYSPKPGAWVNGTTYQRRHILEENVYSFTLNPSTLCITSTASASSPIASGYGFNNKYHGAFLEMLESGKTGIWKRGFPRPAIGHAQMEIDDSVNGGSIGRALEAAIKREFD